MKRILMFSLAVSIFDCYAQDFNYAVLDRKNIVHLLGYDRVTQVLNKKLILTASLNFDMLLIDTKKLLKQGSVSIGGHLLVFDKNKWKIVTALASFNGINNNATFNSNSTSGSIALIGGYYHKKWLLAGEAKAFVPIISKITFNDTIALSSNKAYQGFDDGWYNPSSTMFFFGIQTGYTIKERSDIIIRAGKHTQRRNFNGYILPGFYYSIGINYRFDSKKENDE